MRWRQARWAVRWFALLGCTIATAACFEHILDSTAPPIDRRPIATPPPFDARIAFVSTRDGAPYIYLAPETGAAVHRLTRGERPAWSPDGKQIAFHTQSSPTGHPAIHVINVDGTGERVVATDAANPAWSPDGLRIVFGTTVGAVNGGIHTVNVDGTGRALLISTDFEDPGAGDWLGMPAWSPDGGTIAFVRTNYEKPWQIYVMNADGSGPRVLSSSYAQDPSWSADGSLIAFGAYQNLGSMSADGTGYRIYETMWSAFDPDWSPDGRSLIFSMPQEGRARIHVLDRQSGAVRQLIPDAVAPVAEYRDEQAVWMRAGGLAESNHGRRSPP